MTIEAKVICDSIGEHSSRLVTMLARYPKFVHCEHLRHRSFSFSVSSSRAIPVAKNLVEVRSDDLRAAPVWWGREQKGMQSGDELSSDDWPDYYRIVMGEYGYRCIKTPIETAKEIWKQSALAAANKADYLHECGAHKSIVNRLLEPFLHVNVLVTGTESGWMNFFGLRLDKAAQPEIRTLAEAQWKCWNESRPTKLEPGQWHLPFASDTETFDEACSVYAKPSETIIKISVARCARLSYLSFETNKRSTIEEDITLYDRLVSSSPIHASPAEHQATPDRKVRRGTTVPSSDWYQEISSWEHPDQAGNLGPGWRQYRKMLPGEAVAPLPQEYH